MLLEAFVEIILSGEKLQVDILYYPEKQEVPHYLIFFFFFENLQAIDEKIRELSNCHIVYPGIDFQKVVCGPSLWCWPHPFLLVWLFLVDVPNNMLFYTLKS